MMPERIRRKFYGQMANQLNPISIKESTEGMEILEAINPTPNVSDSELALVVKRKPNGDYVYDENNKPEYIKDSNGNAIHAKGGMVIFSTDMSVETKNPFKKIQADVKNVINRTKLVSTINRVIAEDYSVNANHPQIKYSPIKGYTLKKGMRGRWFDESTGKVFDEASYAVEIIGIDSFVLMAFADSIRVALQQNSVLVIDYNRNNAPFFINPPVKTVPMKEALSTKIKMGVIEFLENVFYKDFDPIAIHQKEVEEYEKKNGERQR